MIIKLDADQIAKHWDVIKFGIQESVPPITYGSQNTLNNMLQSMLTGQMQCWVLMNGTQKIQGVADVNTLLLSYCLLDSEGKAVSIPTIKMWPDRIQTALTEKVKEISDLEDEETDLRESLMQALARSDTPVTLILLRTWVKTLVLEDEESYAVLWDLIKPDSEELAKND